MEEESGRRQALATIEQELKCPVCHDFYWDPLLLACSHSLCLKCALKIQASPPQPSSDHAPLEECPVDAPDEDKVSLYSETDSGVVCNSRPSSYIAQPQLGQAFTGTPMTSLTCPVCHKIVYLDEGGVQSLPRYKTMEHIVNNYCSRRGVKCQLCETNPRDATVTCENCEISYCDECRERCHPARGPLTRHTLTTPEKSNNPQGSRVPVQEPKCGVHDVGMGLYCMSCKSSACEACIRDGQHAKHDLQVTLTMCKAQKGELTQNVQQLTEKAIATSRYRDQLKGKADLIQRRSKELERSVAAECDILVGAILGRRDQLTDYIRQERESKLIAIKDEYNQYTTKLHQTNGLLKFCVEALKENDPISLLQVGNMLISRVSTVDENWQHEVSRIPKASDQIELTLDIKPLLRGIEQLHFLQMKVPGAPIILPEDCTAEYNSITVAWASHASSFVQGYVLELDDGNKGPFTEVYCGKETVCTIDGLHFGSIYRSRVKSFNSAGEGPYSNTIALKTSDVAWFTFDNSTAHPDVQVSSDGLNVTCHSFEHRVVLATIGFSRGVHYWEVTLDKYDSNTDTAFGVAKFDVRKDMMLGKDDRAWSMYVDNKRSWFLNQDRHEKRADGGVMEGSTVGILLDLNKRQLSFYINEEPQGPIAFTNLDDGVYYPAVSLNRNTSLVIHTSLDPPSDHDSD